ncbi:MAG: pectate lyase, partial [Ignavibacteriaceae bacterium]|nr:pectate lyase [Ignavibacteriaceae bacterium]
MISRILFITFFFLPLVILYSQEQINKEEEISISGFYDSAHHWYDIKEEKIIHPLPGKPKYKRSEFRKIADNILLFQKSNGGWTKNYDMMAILTDDQKDSIRLSSNEENTTIDNGTTYSQIEYLAKVFTKTKEEKFMIGCIKGINFLLEAQYNNGGWGQYYPDTTGYRKYITFNDGAMIGVMNLLKSIVDNDEHFDFLESDLKEKVEASFSRGLECILNCQIKIGEKKYVWCQQHDNITLLPQSARTFEPAAICNQESAEIVLFLMSIKNPSKNIKLAIKDAVDWFEESKISGIKVKVVD